MVYLVLSAVNRLMLPTFVLASFIVFAPAPAFASASMAETQDPSYRMASDQPIFSFPFNDGLVAANHQRVVQASAHSDTVQPQVAYSERLYLPVVNSQPVVDDETLIIHSSPIYVTDIQGRVYTDRLTLPYNAPVVFTAELGDNGRDPATWAVGDFTGLYPTGGPDVSQRSLNRDTYGDSAIQMEGTSVGFHLQSMPPSPGDPYQLGQYYYAFDPVIYPWAIGSNARFCIDLDAAVPVSESDDESINYAYVAIAAADRFSDQVVWISFSQYDERQALLDRGDFVHWWAEVANPIAIGVYGGNRYSSLIPGSSTSTSETWDEWRRFGYCISVTQMRTILQDINSKFGLGISEHAEEYGIYLFGVGPEMYIAEGSNSTMSMRVRDVHAFTLNTPEQEFKWDRSMIRSAE